jgi:hypothetical protein
MNDPINPVNRFTTLVTQYETNDEQSTDLKVHENTNFPAPFAFSARELAELRTAFESLGNAKAEAMTWLRDSGHQELAALLTDASLANVGLMRDATDAEAQSLSRAWGRAIHGPATGSHPFTDDQGREYEFRVGVGGMFQYYLWVLVRTDTDQPVEVARGFTATSESAGRRQGIFPSAAGDLPQFNR